MGLVLGSCATPTQQPVTGKGKPGKVAPKGGKASSRTGKQSTVVSEDVADFKELQTLFLKGSAEATKLKSEAFLSKYPGSTLLPQAENILGLSLLSMKKISEAIAAFRRSVQLSGNTPSFTPYVQYNLASALYDAGDDAEVIKVLSGVLVEQLDTENRYKYYHLKLQAENRLSQHYEAVKSGLAASRLMTETQLAELRAKRATLLVLMEQSLTKIENTLALEQLIKDFEIFPLVDLVYLELIRKEFSQNNISKAEQTATILQSRFPQSDSARMSSELLRQLQGQKTVDAAAIGVLLPLKGKFSKFGQKSLQGIEMAFKMFESQEPDSKVTLVVEDSGEEPEQTIAALNRLVLDHHVIAVIGPLLSKGIDQVNQRALELKVPVLSLARHSGSIQNEYVFQTGISYRLQAQEVARYAVQQLGFKKFAVLAPREKAAEEAVNFFWDTVEKLGGEVIGAEYYNSGETDFLQPIDKLSGRYYTEARQRELDVLAKEREINKIKKRTRKTEQYFSLKPIVDYQAVFNPDEPKVSGQVLPSFAYRDVDGIKFLGLTAWNSPELITRLPNISENTYFVDAFYAESTLPWIRKFIEKYNQIFGADPTATEAISYDAARLLEQALMGRPATRSDLASELRNIKNHKGITGNISWADGSFSRNLQVLTVKTGRIVEASFAR